jgi:hypothetical protein
MHDNGHALKLAAAALLALLITACGGGGGSGGSAGDTGRLNLALTDGPPFLEGQSARVTVLFEGVELHGADGTTRTVSFDEPRQITLSDYSGEDSILLLDDILLDAGRYTWLRFLVRAERSTLDSYIELSDGGMYSIYVPSGARSGLKFNGGFEVPAGGVVTLTADFELQRSVSAPRGHDDIHLKPVIRVVENAMATAIYGTVDTFLLEGETPGALSEACADGGIAVYAYNDHQPQEDLEDINQTDNGDERPFATEQVSLVNDSGIDEYRYTLGFMMPGDYTLALTCDAELDGAESEEALEDDFIQVLQGTVASEQTLQLDFAPAAP